MIKPIEIQKPAKLTIIKDGEEVASIYVPGINGVIDKDKLRVETCHDPISMTYNVRIEV